MTPVISATGVWIFIVSRVLRESGGTRSCEIDSVVDVRDIEQRLLIDDLDAASDKIDNVMLLHLR